MTQTILITGASSGIGHAIANRLLNPNYRVVLIGYQHMKGLKDIEEKAQKEGVQVTSFSCDLSKFQEVEDLFKKLEDLDLLPDYLINDAGISIIGLLQDLSFEEWNQILSTNLSSVFATCKLSIPHMVKKQEGKILNISSVWGNVGASCEVAYSATKGGLNAFTKALGKELAPSNISVNAIACGAIHTSMNSFLSKEEEADLLEEIPIGRMIEPEEVADLCYHLLQSPSSLTGQIITLDGAWI